MALYELCWHVVHGGLKVDVAASLLADAMVSLNTSLDCPDRIIKVLDLVVSSVGKSPSIHPDARVQPDNVLLFSKRHSLLR